MNRMIAALALALLAPAFAVAESDERATAVLGKVAEYLAAEGGHSVEVDINYKATVDGEDDTMGTHYSLAVARPDKVALYIKNAQIEITFVANAGTLTTYIPEYSQYTVEEGISSIAPVIERAGFGPIRGAALILSEFAHATPFAEGIEATYVGEETLDGAAAHRLSLKSENVAWDMWVDAGETPLIRKAVPDMTKTMADAKAQGVEVKVAVDVIFADWKKLGDELRFAFNAPDGVEKVAEFTGPASAAEGLAGKPAPAFALDLMSGGKLDLTAKKDTEIYILDFWATWCGPCRRAMPIIHSVSKEFADKGVRLFAVNLRETPEEIKGFLKEAGLEGIEVALDTEGAAGDLYHADSIPQTVIIGKDGKVAKVHVGVGPELESELRAELAALAGGSAEKP